MHGLLYQRLQRDPLSKRIAKKKGKEKKRERERERIVQGSDIIEDAEKKSRLRAVPGPVSRLMDAEQIVC